MPIPSSDKINKDITDILIRHGIIHPNEKVKKLMLTLEAGHFPIIQITRFADTNPADALHEIFVLFEEGHGYKDCSNPKGCVIHNDYVA